MGKNKCCIILGAGPSIGLAVAKKFASEGFNIALASRDINNLNNIAKNKDLVNKNVKTYKVDASNENQVISLISDAEKDLGPIEVGIYNPSRFVKKSILDLSSKEIEEGWKVTCLGGFVFGKEIAKKLLKRNKGTIIFTGATAGMRGSKDFAAFAIGKFGLRALAQSMARELHPKGIHVLWVNIDGVVNKEQSEKINAIDKESLLKPYDIANCYLQLHNQSKNAWSHEVELRPWTEKF
ncbi:MAG: putative oxidoreductase [Alphaproteobacteria bacterium MarineAlpha2_Bin1]|nr:MAG: putative oxidoreductase [Alphaproteobacteria bacterium MarineAlpha2_Bin1]